MWAALYKLVFPTAALISVLTDGNQFIDLVPILAAFLWTSYPKYLHLKLLNSDKTLKDEIKHFLLDQNQQSCWRKEKYLETKYFHRWNEINVQAAATSDGSAPGLSICIASSSPVSQLSESSKSLSRSNMTEELVEWLCRVQSGLARTTLGLEHLIMVLLVIVDIIVIVVIIIIVIVIFIVPLPTWYDCHKRWFVNRLASIYPYIILLRLLLSEVCSPVLLSIVINVIRGSHCCLLSQLPSSMSSSPKSMISFVINTIKNVSMKWNDSNKPDKSAGPPSPRPKAALQGRKRLFFVPKLWKLSDGFSFVQKLSTGCFLKTSDGLNYGRKRREKEWVTHESVAIWLLKRHWPTRTNAARPHDQYEEDRKQTKPTSYIQIIIIGKVW